MSESIQQQEEPVSRRRFVAGAAVVGAAAALPVELSAQVAGSDAVKVGLIGLGGRGSGAIVQNLTASDSAKLVAVADAFQDKIDGSGKRAAGLPNIQQQIEKLGKSAQIDLPKSRQ
jgi:predicted homoserine dehydrogenase-like protein